MLELAGNCLSSQDVLYTNPELRSVASVITESVPTYSIYVSHHKARISTCYTAQYLRHSEQAGQTVLVLRTMVVMVLVELFSCQLHS